MSCRPPLSTVVTLKGTVEVHDDALSMRCCIIPEAQDAYLQMTVVPVFHCANVVVETHSPSSMIAMPNLLIPEGERGSVVGSVNYIHHTVSFSVFVMSECMHTVKTHSCPLSSRPSSCPVGARPTDVRLPP